MSQRFVMDVKLDLRRVTAENVKLELQSVELAKKLFDLIMAETSQISIGVRALDFLALALQQFEGVPDCMRDSQKLTQVGLSAGLIKVSIKEVN